MNDEPPQNLGPGADGEPPKKRRRRRRRNKNKPAQDGLAKDSAPHPEASAEPANNQDKGPARDPGNRPPKPPRPRGKPAPDGRPPKTSGGYRGQNQKASPSQGQNLSAGASSRTTPGGRGKSSDAKPSGRGTADKSSKAPDRPGNAAGKPKTKKRRKPRTKQCVNCYTPCTTIHRVRIDYRKQWVFICDICWPTRCVDNPHYEFGGTWVSGRIVKPESQLRDEWLAKQKQKSTPSQPRTEPSHSHDKPVTESSVQDNASPQTSETPRSTDSGNTKPSGQHAVDDPPTEERQGG